MTLSADIVSETTVAPAMIIASGIKSSSFIFRAHDFALNSLTFAKTYVCTRLGQIVDSGEFFMESFRALWANFNASMFPGPPFKKGFFPNLKL